MTIAHRQLMDGSFPRDDHGIRRHVRRAFLYVKALSIANNGFGDLLEFLAANFADSVCGFSVMDNHRSVLCQLGPDVEKYWSE
jgi:hypothetical protein